MSDKVAWFACVKRKCLVDGTTLKRPIAGHVRRCTHHGAPLIYICSAETRADAKAHLDKLRGKPWWRLVRLTKRNNITTL